MKVTRTKKGNVKLILSEDEALAIEDRLYGTGNDFADYAALWTECWNQLYDVLSP